MLSVRNAGGDDIMKKYTTPTLLLLSIPEEDILTGSVSLVLGGDEGIEFESAIERFGGFNPF